MELNYAACYSLSFTAGSLETWEPGREIHEGRHYPRHVLAQDVRCDEFTPSAWSAAWGRQGWVQMHNVSFQNIVVPTVNAKNHMSQDSYTRAASATPGPPATATACAAGFSHTVEATSDQ
jgi:hypothetical protein